MDLYLFREFITLADTLNYSKASKELFLAQPVLSRHISYLEQQLGTQLLERNRRTVRLTETGKIFYEEAKILIKNYEEVLKKVQMAASGLTGDIRFGFLEGLEGTEKAFIIPIVEHIKENYPTLQLEIFSFDLLSLIDSLNNNNIDVGLTLDLTPFRASEFCCRPLYREPFYAVTRHDHRLAGKSCISISDLATERLIVLSRTNHPGVLDWHVEIFKQEGLIPNIVHEVPRTVTALLMTKMGQGITLMPKYIKIYQKYDLCFLNLDPCTHVDVILVWKRDNKNPIITPFLNEFEALIQNYLGENSGVL